MQIKVLFDKETHNSLLHTGWGVSFLIDNRIVFDTGENGDWLLGNMKNLSVNINTIESAAISHNHWDHVGGLWKLLARKPSLPVYICPHFSAEFKDKAKSSKADLRETKRGITIAENIFLTGEIAGEYKGMKMPEQALVVKTSKGISIITGCSHPGIIEIIKAAKKIFPNDTVYAVMGGFHLIDKDARLIEIIADTIMKLGVKKVGATHCSGPRAEAIFKRAFKNNFIEVIVGKEIAV